MPVVIILYISFEWVIGNITWDAANTISFGYSILQSHNHVMVLNMTLKPQLMECLSPSVWGSVTGQLWKPGLLHLTFPVPFPIPILMSDLGEVLLHSLQDEVIVICSGGWTPWIIMVLIPLFTNIFFDCPYPVPAPVITVITYMSDRANSPQEEFRFLWVCVPYVHSQITRSFPTARFCSLDKVQLLYVGKRQGSMEL